MPWEAGRELDAKAWERAARCTLSYRGGVWECWAHGVACPALEDGKLRSDRERKRPCGRCGAPYKTTLPDGFFDVRPWADRCNKCQKA